MATFQGKLLTAAVLLALVAGCSGPDRARAGASPAEPPRSLESTAVEETPDTLTVKPGPTVRSSLTVDSRIVTESEVYVVARTTGQILKVLVERGEHVVQGQVLAEFENREEELVLRAAEAELDLAETIESNRRSLYEDDMVPEELLLQAQTELKLARARVELARFRFQDTKVQAPLAGVILDRMAREGMYILESDTVPLFRLAGEGPREIRAYLPEWALPYLHEGDPVTLRPVFGSHPLEGRLHWLSPVVDPVAGTVEVRVRPADGDSPRKGSAVQLEFELVSDPELPTVPRESLLGSERRPGEMGEILVSSGEAGWERRSVRLGLVGPLQVEIRSGLGFGERIRAVAPAAEPATEN